jgi:hypothetical protein
VAKQFAAHDCNDAGTHKHDNRTAIGYEHIGFTAGVSQEVHGIKKKKKTEKKPLAIHQACEKAACPTNQKSDTSKRDPYGIRAALADAIWK